MQRELLSWCITAFSPHLPCANRIPERARTHLSECYPPAPLGVLRTIRCLFLVMHFGDIPMIHKDLFPGCAIPPQIHLPNIPKDQNLASEFHHRLINWINDFHKSLDEEHEAGARLVSFGQSLTFHIEDIGWWNPSLISFIGKTENGEPVELIQHVSQISILLIKMKRLEPQAPKRPIGFASWDEYESQKT